MANHQQAEKRWLTLREAAFYSALGRKKLVRLALEKVVSAHPEGARGDWIFCKKSLDEYHLRQIEQDSTTAAMKDAASRLGL